MAKYIKKPRKPAMSNAERQKKYYYNHKHEKSIARQMLGVSTYTDAHRRYFIKKKGETNGEF